MSQAFPEDPPNQAPLEHPPEDGITNLEYHPTKVNLLLASSWDKTIRLYDTNTYQMRTKTELNTPILDSCFGDNYQVFGGGVNGSLYSVDLGTGTKEVVGHHTEGVSSVCWSSAYGLLYSGSWDKTLRLWDPRRKGNLADEDKLHRLHHKIYSMDVRDNILALALSNNQVYIYDIRNMKAQRKERGPYFQHMLRCVRVMPGGKGIATSSIEGRASLDYLSDGGNLYSFKLHRHQIGDKLVVYPVNSLSFHPRFGTFASGGSDGVVNIWDGENQKLIRQFSKFPEEISNVAFNSDGTQLAIARSYTYDEGERHHYPDAIYIRRLNDNDCKPSQKSAKSTQKSNNSQSAYTADGINQ